MSSILKQHRVGAGWASLLIVLTGLAGCSTREKVVYDPVNHKPFVGDEAMALRADWPKSVAHYANGNVVAFSTRFPYETKATEPAGKDLLLEPILFLGQITILPVELVANPPGDVQVWHGVEYPPTYTAQPPLPPPGGERPRGATVGPAAMPDPQHAAR